ncbi:MAG: CoA-binding protein [Candidatus Helarchaeota archaeon]
MNKLELIDYFFHPKNVTLIGVSRNLLSASGMILSNIIRSNYEGPLHLINPNIEEGRKILGKSVKRSIKEINDELDLTFVIVPSRIVPSVLEEIGSDGKAVVIISSGFGESILYDKEKLSIQDEIVRIAKKNGFVFTGPNCNGVYSDAISLNAIFGPRIKCLSGHISYVTRGGTAGINSLIESTVRGIGVSKFINLGGAAYLTIQDFIEYYGQDPETKVIGAYTEGINNGKEFIRIIKKVNKEKPVVFFKSGNTLAGRKAALSHVGAIAGEHSNKIFEGAVKQTGMIPVESLSELVDVCTSFMITYIPRSRNIGIITPAGSLGVTCSDACNKEGLNLPPLSSSLIEKLNKWLPEYWSHNNPIDITDSMNFNVFSRIIKLMLNDDRYGGLIVLFGDVGDNQGEIMDFAVEGFGNFDEIIKQQVKKISKNMEKIKKPVFFLGPVRARNGLPEFFHSQKIVVLPEFRKIARIYSAMARWFESTKKEKI